MIRLIRFTTLVLAALSILSCGGGSGTPVVGQPPAPLPPPAGGIEGTGFAVGSIDGFGSIFVNGIEFETDTAQFVIDDQPGIESELRIGQIVFVAGTFSADGLSGAADQVRYDTNVEGPIASIDTGTGTLVVVGQLVIVSAQTTFGDVPGGDLNGLNTGDPIKVSGFIGADGSITATRIDLDDSPDGEAEVRGRVSNVDAVAMTLMINSQLVDYSSAMLDGFNSGSPQDGDNVEVHGTLNGETLVATQVEREDSPSGDEGDEVEIEGLVTRFASPADFDVAGFAATTTNTTTFENGTVSQLALNLLVEVEGEINANGVLVADKVEFGSDGSIRIDGVVEAVDSGANELTVMTIPIRVNASTRIEDKTDADVRPFSLANLNVGDYVEIRGLLSPASLVIASRLEREDPESDVTLRGPVGSVANPDFTILDVVISTSAQTQFVNTTSAEFFATAAGQIVEAKGTWDGTRIVADSVSFED